MLFLFEFVLPLLLMLVGLTLCLAASRKARSIVERSEEQLYKIQGFSDFLRATDNFVAKTGDKRSVSEFYAMGFIGTAAFVAGGGWLIMGIQLLK